MWNIDSPTGELGVRRDKIQWTVWCKTDMNMFKRFWRPICKELMGLKLIDSDYNDL